MDAIERINPFILPGLLYPERLRKSFTPPVIVEAKKKVLEARALLSDFLQEFELIPAARQVLVDRFGGEPRYLPMQISELSNAEPSDEDEFL